MELLTGFSDSYIAVNFEESAVNVHESLLVSYHNRATAVKQCSGAWRDCNVTMRSRGLT